MSQTHPTYSLRRLLSAFRRRSTGGSSRSMPGVMLEPLEARAMLSGTPELVQAGIDPRGTIIVGSTLYFSATDSVHGRELWKSDGTPEGTTLVKDIRPGVDDSNSPSLRLQNVGAAALNDKLFFIADDGVTGTRLWVTDGTPANTKPILVDFRDPDDMVAIGNYLVFTAEDDAHGRELWISDGTEAGTTLFMDIQPGPGTSFPSRLMNFDGKLVFLAEDNAHGRELWISDGTETGTTLIKDILPGPDTSFPVTARGRTPSQITNFDGKLIFQADDGVHGQELWISDGTEAGTVLVKDIASGITSSFPYDFTLVDNTIFFSAETPTNGAELWKTDGTSAGTKLVKDIQTGSTGSYPHFLMAVNGKVYFTADNGPTGTELWKSDGTASGTVLVKDINTGTYPDNYPAGSFPQYLTGVNGKLYFSADDGVKGQELWVHDDILDTTTLFNINPNSHFDEFLAKTIGEPSFPSNLINFNGTLFFGADDGTNGPSLFRLTVTETTEATARNLSAYLYPQNLTSLGGTLYFSGRDTDHGRELWKSDGTPEGTTLVKDVQPGTFDSYPTLLTDVNGTLFFVAERSNGPELWKSDGTEVGTKRVLGNFGFPTELTAVDGMLFFAATDADHGTELWKSDGTNAGTVLVKDIRPGTDTSYPSYLTAVNGTLFFTANDGVHGFEFWSSDGTPEGTTMIKDIRSGGVGSDVMGIVAAEATAYFAADNGVHGLELWKSDGTVAGTVLVKDIRPGTNTSYPSYLTTVNGKLYFTADNGVTGEELWKSDGTTSGTVLVKDIRPGTDASYPRYLTTVNGKLYFTADNGVTGEELWKSDGTTSGTVLVKDINVSQFGDNSSFPRSLTDLNGKLYFSAENLSHDRELYSYDGATDQTTLFNIDPRIAPDDSFAPMSSNPEYLTAVGSNLFFAAMEGTSLWSATEGQAPTGPNHAPSGTSKTTSTPRNTPYTLTVADFGFSDPDDTTSNALLSVKVTTYPTHGSLKKDGVSVTTGQAITAVDIASGKLVFTPAAMPFGSPYATFSFQVRDDGGTDNGGVDLDPTPNTLTFNILEANQAPTDISLASSSIAENQPSGTSIGVLSTTNPDNTSGFTYSLVSGTGGDDNGSFTIDGATLMSAASFNFEAKNSYTIRVRTTDAGGQSFDKAFTINVTDVADANGAPTDISLSGNSIAENTSSQIAIGTFTATDPDNTVGNTSGLSYSLVPGAGSDYNGAFLIDEDSTLRQLVVFDYESSTLPAPEAHTVSIRVRVTDSGGLYFEKAFTIHITDVNEQPSVTAGQFFAVAEHSPAGTVVGTFVAASDPDVFDSFHYRMSTASAFAIHWQTGVITVKDPSISFAANPFYALTVQVTDRLGLSGSATVMVGVSTKLGMQNGKNADLVFYTSGGKNTVSLKGGGSATLTGGQDTAGHTFYDMDITGSTLKSGITIKAPKGSLLNLRNVTVDPLYSLKSFSAPTAMLTGTFTAAGLQTLTLGPTSKDAMIKINPPADGSTPKPLTVKMTEAFNLRFDSAYALKSLTATSWTHDAGRSTFLMAPSLGILKITGNKKTGNLGDFATDVLLSNANLKLTLGMTSIFGMADGAHFISAGNIGSFTVGAMRNSTLAAGFTGVPTSLPTAFNTVAAITSVTVKDLPGNNNGFVNSLIYGATLGSITLKDVQTSNAGFAEGVVAHTLESYVRKDAAGKVVKKLSKLVAPIADADNDTLDDFLVTMV